MSNGVEVRCWGSNNSGQLGQGASSNSAYPIVLSPPLNKEVTALSAGMEFVCALLVDKTVKCWGANDQGQLGNDLRGNDSSVPVKVPFSTPPLSLATGFFHACVGHGDRTLTCWGYNESGQLGVSGVDVAPAPIKSSVQGDATTLRAGGAHTCINDASGALQCWGSNETGQLGIESAASSSKAVSPLIDNVRNVFLNFNSKHSCAQLKDGRILCWGDNAYGQLGTGDQTTRGIEKGSMATLIPVPL